MPLFLALKSYLPVGIQVTRSLSYSSTAPSGWAVAYFAAFREEDSCGKLGVTLKKDLLQAVGETFRPLIREVAKGLKLNARDVEAILMTLHRFGNYSSSSWWYELAYIEGKERVKKGDKTWLLRLGIGLKCCSLVWECVRPIVDESKRSSWSDCIHRYPIEAIDQGFQPDAHRKSNTVVEYFSL
ncbi:hypothetical protein CRYUN_Cryun07bG0093600 [Craigia yunnanensis]